MNTGNDKHIEGLLERFFEGQTSNKEEQLLYEFFASNDVPEHMLRYKQVFAYFENGVKEAFSETKTGASIIEKVAPVHRIHNKKWILWSSVAAVLLILILSNPFTLDNKPFNPYEGSYIVRNGVRITDPEIIRPELEATVQKVIQQKEETELFIAQLKREREKTTSVEDIMKEHYKTILDSFEDETIRNEVKKIIEKEY